MSRNRMRASLVTLATYAVVVGGLTGCERARSPMAPAPTQLVALTPTSIGGVAGSQVEPVPTLRVRNDCGAPVANARVTFE